MPIFTYECEEGHTHTRLQSFNDSCKINFSCPVCYEQDGRMTLVKKVMSVPAKGVVKGFNDKNNYGLKETK